MIKNVRLAFPSLFDPSAYGEGEPSYQATLIMDKAQAEGLDKVHTLSTFRGHAFHADYGVDIADGPLRGLTARAVLVLDENDTVLHSQLVGEIADEPDYAAAVAALG